MSLGANLKRERELRGISLEEISYATKISRRLLEALEEDRFDSLPGGIFRKAFLKSYANYMGMNEEQVLQEYTLAFESPPLNPEEKQQTGKASREPKRAGALLIAGILALLILGVVYFLLRPSNSTVHVSIPPAAQPAQPPKSELNSTRPATEPQSIAATSLSSPISSTIQPGNPANEITPASPNPMGSSASTGNPQLKVLGELAKKPEPLPLAPVNSNARITDGPIELTLEATEQTWISAASGENKLFKGIMMPNDSKKFSLQTPLSLVLGNAGGVKVVVNGQLLAPLGRTREKKEIVISAENYKQFLPPTH